MRRALLNMTVGVAAVAGWTCSHVAEGAFARDFLAMNFSVIRLEISASDLNLLAQRMNEPVPALAGFDADKPATNRIQAQLVSPAYRGNGKPEFLVVLDGEKADSDGGEAVSYYLRSSIKDSSYLGEFCASHLASSMGVPAPEIGHARVLLNGKDLGLYVIKEAIGKVWLSRRLGSNSGVLLQGKSQDVDGLLGTDYPKGASRPALLDELIQVCLETNLQRRLEMISNVVDLSAFCRFMAWEALVLNSSGYCEGLGDYWVYVDESVGRITFLPNEIDTRFGGTKLSALNGKRALVARSVMELPKARVQFLKELDAVTADPEVESNLLLALEERGRILESMAMGPLERDQIRFFKAELISKVRKRFSEIRKQLRSHPILDEQSMAKLKISPIRFIGQGQSGELPVRSNLDYRKKFDDLYADTTEAAGAIPVHVHELRIISRGNEVKSLSWQSTNWVSVDVHCEGQVFRNVALRLKGYGTRRDFNGKSSFTLKLNQIEKGQQFEGQTKIHLHSAVYNASYLNEFLVAWLFGRVGQPCPRVEFGRVWVNQEDYGLFVIVEGTTKNFLERAFGQKDGFLFEGTGGDIDGPMDLDSGTLPANYDRISRLHGAALSVLQTQSLEPLKPYCNIESLAEFVALETILGHEDGYALSAHNYRIYQPGPDRPFVLIPHGADNLRVYSLSGVVPVMKGILARAVTVNGDGLGIYLRCMQRILEDHLDVDLFARDAAQVCRLIAAPLRASDPLNADNQLRSARNLVGNLADRKAYLLHHLALELSKDKPAATLSTRQSSDNGTQEK